MLMLMLLGLERGPSGSPAPLAGSLDTRRGCGGGGGRLTRRNVFDFPPAAHTLSRLNGASPCLESGEGGVGERLEKEFVCVYLCVFV